MPGIITDVEAIDIRFPTSRSLDGSDAMNPDPDYSAAYVVLHTDIPGGLKGHGLTFTIGRGNEICVAAINSLKPLVIGLSLDEAFKDPGGFWRHITGDSQFRWLGPEKGVIHLASAAIINAIWDLMARSRGLPLWKLLVEAEPEWIVSAIPFSYITDALTPEEALAILRRNQATKSRRETEILERGYPAYTTSAGWLGYSDDKIRGLLQEAMADGWTHFKMKVGRDLNDDIRRAKLIREEIGRERVLMMDANQVWDVPTAIQWIRKLAPFNPNWIEEPTSPDDVLGHAAIARAVTPVRIATGEHCHNRVMFKQFFQADALRYCQLDSCRLAGVNEVLAVILMAAKFNIPVCPHAGGVGLCEYVQHYSIFDYICSSGTLDGRRLEFVDHLHEHFVDPVIIEKGPLYASAGPRVQHRDQA